MEISNSYGTNGLNTGSSRRASNLVMDDSTQQRESFNHKTILDEIKTLAEKQNLLITSDNIDRDVCVHLGKGNFGTVDKLKVRLSADKEYKEVAAKRLKTGEDEAEDVSDIDEVRLYSEFKREILSLLNFHRNNKLTGGEQVDKYADHIVKMVGIYIPNFAENDEDLTVDENKSYLEAPILFMNLYVNGDLQSYLKFKQKDDYEDTTQMSITWSQGLKWCFELAKAVKFLKLRSVVHKDVAARNCFLDQNLKLVLGDFGLATKIDDDEEDNDVYHQYKYAKFIVKDPVPKDEEGNDEKGNDEKSEDPDQDDGQKDQQLPWAYLPITTIMKLGKQEENGGQIFSHGDDIWAMGITFWEIFTYCDIKLYHREIPNLYNRMTTVPEKYKKLEKFIRKDGRLGKGTRQWPDSIYWVILMCWRLHPDERITSSGIIEILQKMMTGTKYQLQLDLTSDVRRPRKIPHDKSGLETKLHKDMVDDNGPLIPKPVGLFDIDSYSNIRLAVFLFAHTILVITLVFAYLYLKETDCLMHTTKENRDDVCKGLIMLKK